MCEFPVLDATGERQFSPSLFFLRSLSFFHFWLPWLLIYIVWKLGYDRRAFLRWWVLAWALLLVCYFFMPEPPPAPEYKLRLEETRKTLAAKNDPSAEDKK